MRINTFINMTKEERNKWIRLRDELSSIEMDLWYDGRDTDHYINDDVTQFEMEYLEKKGEVLGKYNENHNSKAQFLQIYAFLNKENRNLFKEKYFALAKENKIIFREMLQALYSLIFSKEDVAGILFDLENNLIYEMDIDTDIKIQFLDEYLEPFYKPIIYQMNKNITTDVIYFHTMDEGNNITTYKTNANGEQVTEERDFTFEDLEKLKEDYNLDILKILDDVINNDYDDPDQSDNRKK